MSRMKQFIELRNLTADLAEERNERDKEDNLDLMTVDSFSIPDEGNSITQPVSFEALQKHCTQKACDGYTDEIRKIIHSHNAENLIAIEPKYYSDVWMEIESL
ncbi:hypothetical protein ACX4ZB_06735 [Aerococcus urinae]